MKKRNRIDGANSLFIAKIEQLLSAISWLKPEDMRDYIIFDIDEFRAGRVIEKLDQCIRNVNDIRKELVYINPEIEEEEESIFELEGGEERFQDQYKHGIFTEIVKLELGDENLLF